MSKIIPKVVFNPTKAVDNVNIIKWTYNDSSVGFSMREWTISLFPEFKDCDDANPIIEKTVRKHLISDKDKIASAVNHYQKVWDKYNDKYMAAISKTLNIDWPADCKKIGAYVGIMPIYPRYIESRTFDVSYWLKDDKIIDITAHESCHFLYFEKWKQLFPDYNESEFDSPHLIWELSEMVVDPILNRPEFQKIFNNHNFFAYDYFYAGEATEMNKIKEIYANNTIEDAIKLSYEFMKTSRSKQ